MVNISSAGHDIMDNSIIGPSTGNPNWMQEHTIVTLFLHMLSPARNIFETGPFASGLGAFFFGICHGDGVVTDLNGHLD